MSRVPSVATQLRNVRRALAAMTSECKSIALDCRNYRARATRAEQECAEWKERFERLLAIKSSKDGDA